MKIIGDTQIVRTSGNPDFMDFMEWEIPVAYNVEELYKGTNDSDDPSSCTVNEMVKVVEDVGPFRVSDMLVLTEDERDEIEQEEVQKVL